MPRKLIPVFVVLAVAVGAAVYLRSDRSPEHYTGFVEGEERIIRSEVSGRVVEMRFAEGAKVAPGAVVAVLNDNTVVAQIRSKDEEIAALAAEIRAQQEQIALIETTWKHDVSARRAELRQAQSAAALARRTLDREQGLVASGASTEQMLDDNRARRDQADSALDRSKEVLASAEAAETQISLARRKLESLESRRALSAAQRDELQILQSKYEVRGPEIATIVQTQFLWPGELAQPGTAVVGLLAPADKYVQLYVPVSEIAEFTIGRRVDIELDSAPGRRTPGEVSFVAEKASFTPEKIETRSDRMSQVYRVKIRIREDADKFQPGTEGNVYLGS